VYNKIENIQLRSGFFMTGILLAAGSIGVVCAAGSGLVAALKFFNTWEPDFSSKSKSAKSLKGGAHNERFENLSKRARPGSEL
jgi:hypothetical protein